MLPRISLAVLGLYKLLQIQPMLFQSIQRFTYQFSPPFVISGFLWAQLHSKHQPFPGSSYLLLDELALWPKLYFGFFSIFGV